MKKYLIAALSILVFAGAALCGSDNYPVSAGSTQPRSLGGITFDGAFGNPALVGLDRYPRGGLSLLPTSIALWSDKLAPPFNEYLFRSLTDDRYLPMYLTSLLEESFGVSADTAIMDYEKVSEILTKELRGGINLYVGAQTSPIVFSTRGFALNARSYVDIDMKIPDGLLLPLFSETDGILAGGSLNMSDLRVEAMWASEVAVKVGFSTVVPAFRDYLKLDRGALGAGAKLIFGHSYFKAEADKSGALNYDTVSNKYNAEAAVDIVSVGTGLHGEFQYDKTLLRDNPINGQGWGLDLGAVFHNDRHMLSFDVQDIGMIFWNGKQVHRGTLAFDTTFDAIELASKFSDIFGLDSQSLESSNEALITWLPMALNAGYSYYYELPKDSDAKFLLGYLSTSLNYRQQLLLGPGRNTYMPRFAAGVTAGLLAGCLPVRYGLVAGGPEKLASVVGAGIDLKYVSLDASYKTVGSPILIPEKGFEAAAALTFRWRWKPPRGYVKAPRDEAPAPEAPPPEPEPEAPPLPELKEPPAVVEEPVVYAPVEIVLVMYAPPQPTVEETQKLNTSQRAINFRTGGAELTPSSYAALNGIAELLKQYSHVRYEIQGHTDSQGADMYNLLLSAERAAAVKTYLVARGAPEASLIAIGYGENMPIANNATAEGRALNRRVEFVQIISQEHYDTLKKFETEMMRNMTKRAFEKTR